MTYALRVRRDMSTAVHVGPRPQLGSVPSRRWFHARPRPSRPVVSIRVSKQVASFPPFTSSAVIA
jgi:hypothetical protein